MSTSTLQFVTQMKLRELHRQRARLREAYEQLGRKVADATDTGERLRTLYHGLRELKVAGQRLHPEVVNLDVLFCEQEAGTLSPAVAALWQGRLQAELSAGRLRSEFVYLFGALLEEWAREPATDARQEEESRQARQQLLDLALAHPEPKRHREAIDPLFADPGKRPAEMAERLQREWPEALAERVSSWELQLVLKRLSDNIYHPPRLRCEAGRFAADEMGRKELADALTILLAELAAWNWPREGLAVRAVWTRNKWRLYLDEDLPTACLLEVIGSRWASVLERVMGDVGTPAERRARLKKLLDLNAPEVILVNERRMLQLAEERQGLGLSLEQDAWSDESYATDPEASSIVVTRAQQQRSLRHLLPRDDYDDGYGGSVSRLVSFVHAEIRLARAAFPERPLVVVKIDLQDCYASLPHDVLLTILARLGLPERERDFFARYLAPPLSTGAGAVRMRRGVPMNHALSATLAESLLRLLERHVSRHARVQIIRLVDDICLLTPDPAAAVAAWRRVEEFCTACGLKINHAKCGAICLGGRLPDGLPAGRPRWGMVELDEEGRWQVHQPTFDAHREQTRERVASAWSVLTKVQLYNANIKFLTAALALPAPLDDVHRAAALQAVRQFHQDFFGAGRSLVAGLDEMIRERFLSGAAAVEIPDAWVYWPITAGGLGLQNPVVIAAQYAEAYRRRERVEAPKERTPGWNLLANEWSNYYQQFLEVLEPGEPQETKVMKTLVDDFIQRGSDISAGKQQGLSAYWRWVLYTYGPQILERFGTFRFLLTELVPLQLISQQRVQDTSLNEAKRAGEDKGELAF